MPHPIKKVKGFPKGVERPKGLSEKALIRARDLKEAMRRERIIGEDIREVPIRVKIDGKLKRAGEIDIHAFWAGKVPPISEILKDGELVKYSAPKAQYTRLGVIKEGKIEPLYKPAGNTWISCRGDPSENRIVFEKRDLIEGNLTRVKIRTRKGWAWKFFEGME